MTNYPTSLTMNELPLNTSTPEPNEEVKLEKTILTTNGWIDPAQFKLFKLLGVKTVRKLNLKNKNIHQLQKLARRYPLISEEVQKEYLDRTCDKVTVKAKLK